MGNEVQEIVVPLLGALQAAVAVLLTILVGVVAFQLGWLSNHSSQEISKICVNLFLPALLIYNVGSEIELDTAIRVVPIIIWAICHNSISILWGFTATSVFKLPDWVTPAVAFNNTTALPLLLIQSLGTTGILDSIDSSGNAVSRAKYYLLMNAMVGNSLTFALGPKLLHGQNEDAPDEEKDQSDEAIEQDVAQQDREAEEANEESSLLPNRAVNKVTHWEYAGYRRARKVWARLPPSARVVFGFLLQFWNPPLIGAAIGIVIGIVPVLHRAFFNPQSDGGYLTAWLTSAIKNCGDLFASLQVITVGVKLANSLVRAKHGESSGKVPWAPTTFILVTRFILWPAISIPVIYLLVAKTHLLSDDPLLWFCMMLMPTGPPALKLTALADVNGASDEEKMTISKLLVIAYAVSPIICFTVVGSLKASQAGMTT